MFVWFIVVCLYVIVSFVQHLGVFDFSFLGNIGNVIIDIIVLIIVLGILYRMTIIRRKGRREKV